MASRSPSPSRSVSPPESVSFDQLQAVRNVQIIERNEYPLRHLAQEKVRRRARREDDDEEGALCFCTYPDSVEREQDANLRRCDDVSCLNFATYVECSANCATDHFCKNQRLQHPEKYPQLEPFKTDFKGYGVRTLQHISQLSIVGEYVGEIIDQKELAKRLKSVPRHELNFYYLLLAPGVYIDARNKGSFTRFVNHSCEPNCKTEKWTVEGETRIAVIALRDIQVGEELTFDYQWKALGSRQIKCFCGAESCKGVIGTVNEKLQNAAGYFRDPEKLEIGNALVGRRVRVFVSLEDKAEYDVQLVKSYDEEQDRYEVEDLLEVAGYETDENDTEEEGEKQFVKLKENGWQMYCPPGDKEERVFAIPKKRNLSTSSGPVSAAGSREPSPKRAGETASLSPVGIPSPAAVVLNASAKLESSFSTAKRNQLGELIDADGQAISTKLLVKFLPKEYNAVTVRSLFLSRKHPNALVDVDVFNFFDGTGWALVELENTELASSFRRTLDRRNLLNKILRVYQAGYAELEKFHFQKSKMQMMRQQGMTDRSNTSPSEEKENIQVVERKEPYCFGRKLNWLVTEEELKNLSVQQVLSPSLEETLRVKYVKSIFHIAKGLRLDREDATSAIIALNRFFTFHAMPMEVDIYAATMLHLFLKAHARKVPWTAFVKEVYKAKHGSSAAELLTAASPELGVLKRHLVKAEGELLEGLHYDVTGEDPYALLDFLTNRKRPKKLAVSPFLPSQPPPEVQKETKHLVAEALPLPIWTRTPVECVMLSVVYVSAAVTEALSPSAATPVVKVLDFLPRLDLQTNAGEARMLLECSLSICIQLKERWTRLEKKSKAAQQQKQKQPKELDESEFDMEQFAVSRDKKDVDISERIAQLLKLWINLPPTSGVTTAPSVLGSCSTISAVASVSIGAGTLAQGTSAQSGERGFITFKAMGASVPAPRSSSTQNNESEGVISALSIFPKKTAAGATDTSANDIRLHTDEITKVESIRKRAFLGVISNKVNLDLAGQSVYLQSWPYLEQEVFFTEERGINEACLREISAATTLSSLLPDRFMKLRGIIFPADKKDRQANESGGAANGSSPADELDLLAATIDDDGNPLPEGMDRLTRQKHYLAFEQPLHMFSGIFEAHVALTPELRKKSIFDMLHSLAAVHDKGYVHRFVAPSHLLVFENGIKLGGFHAMRKIANIKPKDGEGSSIAAYEMSDNERKEHCYGAWLHVSAPEVLLGETKFTWRADVWSAGCVALTILLEKVPFLQGPDLKVQLDLIYRLCGTPSSSWEGAHKLPLYNAFRPKHEFKTRLCKTLLEQRSKFPDFPEDAVEMLEAMLQLDPVRRSTIKKLLEMRYFDSVRSNEQVFDFSSLPSTFPVQKKKLVQHLLKSKAKKQRSSRSSHHSSHRHSSSEYHRHKRSTSSNHDGSSSGGDKAVHPHDRHRSRSDKRKSRSLSTSRREVKPADAASSTEDVEMQDASEHVPLPASFTASAGTSPLPSALGGNDGLPPREKRVKLGWGMGLNSAS